MAFGDDSGPGIKVCCGPRCGQEPGHRTLYAAVEAGSLLPVRPVGCQGHCTGGVTVVFPNGTAVKVRTVADVNTDKSLRKILTEEP